jgi:ParB family chromosome partitioning protein
MSSSVLDAATTAPTRSRRRFTVDALFTDHRPQAVGVSDLATAKEIRIDRIEPDPAQPRRTFDLNKLAELAASIEMDGVLQPVVVRYDTHRDIYVMVHGERRWRAACKAGLETIPAIVRDVPEERRLVQQLVENIVREDLNAVDRAAALRAIKIQLGDAPWEQVAEAVGIRRSRLFQLLGTEKLPDAAREDIRAGRLSEKQSRALQGLPPGKQEALRAAIVDGNLSVDDAMRLARSLRSPDVPDDPAGAALVLVELHEARHNETVYSSDDDRLGDLLSAISAAATGGRGERAALARSADAAGAAPYERQRLNDEILALARTLARTPEADLRPGGAAYAPLAALYGTLDALLNPTNG